MSTLAPSAKLRRALGLCDLILYDVIVIQPTAQMLNFGALIAFMGVNLAALVRYYLRERQKRLRNLLPRMLGFAVCLLLWLNLSRTAQIAGGIWTAAGIAYGAWNTRGFHGELVDFEITAENQV